ncbi:UNVERIFIED_CONTAM: membrane protease YdiL (CAAX protease family) [Brevibacillus sp. OAP136]
MKRLLAFILGFLILDFFFYLPGIIMRLANSKTMFAILAIAFFFIAIVVIKKTGAKSFSEIGLTKHRSWGRNLLIGFLFGAVFPSFYFLVEVKLNIVTITNIVPTNILLFMLLLALIQFAYTAFAEEIVTRGYLYKNLTQYLSTRNTVIIASIVFASHHWQHYGQGYAEMIRLFFDGVLYGVIFLKTRSLWFGIGLHWANNISSVLFSQMIQFSLNSNLLWLDWTLYYVMQFIMFFTFIFVSRFLERGNILQNQSLRNDLIN